MRLALASITNKRIVALSIAFIEDNLVIREILSDDKSSIPAVSIKSYEWSSISKDSTL